MAAWSILKMKTAIQQPEHIPWIGFFNKMSQCDLFVYLDNVQFKKRYFENRNKVLRNREVLWLTVPVITKGLQTQNICDVQIDYDQAWQKKYKGRLEHAYGKLSTWKDIKEITFPPLEKSFEKLIDLNLALINNIRDYLGINTPTERASKMPCSNSKGSDLILEICSQCNTRTYISGPDGKNYLESEKFIKKEIEIVYHKFQHPKYPQMVDGFISHMSVLDLIANHGGKSLDAINVYQINH